MPDLVLGSTTVISESSGTVTFPTGTFNGKPGIRWYAYRRLRDLRNMDAIEKEMVSWIEEMEKQREQNPFDEKVANAIANGEVEMSINKNTQ